MSRVTINVDILNWALNRSGLTLDFLENKFPKIKQWVGGLKQPTLKQLESLSKTTLTPFGYFFLKSPPREHLPIPYYRTIDDNIQNAPSPELLETVYMMQRRQNWMREFLIKQGHEPLSFIKSVAIDEFPENVGRKLRDKLDLSHGWASKQRTWTEALRHLREAMENIGIMVSTNGIVGNNTHRKLDTNEFRGFVLVDNYAPLVFINGGDCKSAQMFTLAHELAHVFIGKSAVFDLRYMQPSQDPIEQVCDKIAAEFLVPIDEIKSIWSVAKNDFEPFQFLAREFKVSALVAARRMLDVGLIRKDEFYEFYRSYVEDERRKKVTGESGGDNFLNQNMRLGRLFASAVIMATKEGKLLYSEAYRLTGLYGDVFENYAEDFLHKG